MDATTVDSNVLDRECAVYCRYLVGQEPNEYVKQKYRAAHQSGLLRSERAHPADAFLVKIASIAPWGTKIIDSYTRLFRPLSMVRKKLVLVLAILESCAPSDAYLNSEDSDSIPLLCLRLVQRCTSFVLVVLVGILVILPADLTLRGRVKRVAS